MSFEKQTSLAKATKVSFNHTLFFPRLFSLLAQKNDYDDLSRRIDRTKIQESCSIRNILRTRDLANIIIDDKGEINKESIPGLIKEVKAKLYSLGPNRQYDGPRQKQILSVLHSLQKEKDLVILLKKIGRPAAHRQAEQIIRDTLALPANSSITDAHARRAALAAWMCTLRQSVGSCFATAPALIIHDEQPHSFLEDIHSLLATGRLKRTFGGIEYAVPLSPSWGVGDLRKVFLLDRGLVNPSTEIWQSPSFIHALESVGIIKKENDYKRQVEHARQLVSRILERWEGRQQMMQVSVEEIFKRVLMSHLGIKRQDLEDYDNRPKLMVYSSLLMQAPTSHKGGKGEACATYYKLLEEMSNIFKGYADNALLKAWEFTLASFSETKAVFARWNLYSSLGLGPEEEGGIGRVMYNIIKEKLDQCNAKVQEYQGQYEQLYGQLKFLEGRMKQAETESEMKWYRVEYQMRSNEFYTFQEVRDEAHFKAKRFADLFNTLIELYDNKFPEYFQEIYDADMHEVQMGPYDDSPAGFRLLYKHGRSNTSQWTMIYNANEFIEALISFFTATEHELVADSKIVGLEEDFSQIVTSVINHLKTTEFINTAFYRMAAAHHKPIIKDPLDHLDKIEKKPWAYTSGGTMETLVSCYYKREQKPSEVSRWVENETELAVFLLDTIKQIHYSAMKEYVENPHKSLIMHSPTHAFLLKPGIWPFVEGWSSDLFTYTWVRDNLVVPMRRFLENQELDPEKIRYLIEELVLLVPPNYQHHFKNVFTQNLSSKSPRELRDFILDTLNFDPGFRSSQGPILQSYEIDSLLFSQLPLFSHHQLREKIEAIFSHLSLLTNEHRKKLMQLFDELFESMEPGLMNAKGLKDCCLALISLAKLSTASAEDFHWHISLAAQQLGFALPTPFIFADTNWVKDWFGFTINPGTEAFELWRMDYTGSVGQSMEAWKQWLDGSRKDLQWGVYNKPHEYRS